MVTRIIACVLRNTADRLDPPRRTIVTVEPIRFGDLAAARHAQFRAMARSRSAEHVLPRD